MPHFFESAEKEREHYYHIEYNGREHEVVCPGFRLSDGGYAVVIPWYLIIGRRYPIQVYLYACGLYSSNPELGQRGVAEATRRKFGLTTFSHSTVCRAFKSFEQARKEAEERFGEEVAIWADDPTSVPTVSRRANGPAHNESGIGGARGRRKFPSARDTLDRRRGLAMFLRAFRGAKAGRLEAVESDGREFVKNWHIKTRKLLL